MKLQKKKYIKYTGKVYDLKVSTKDHSYVVDDIIVHNSAGGALISFLLKITQIDPIRWNLLFERFINKGRIQKSLPDIDIDVQTAYRDEVKGYIRDKYGFDQFCYIGTYTTLQLKGTFKELCRLNNVEFSESNYLTSILDFEDQPEGEFVDIFRNAVSKSRLKNFIMNNVDLINDIPLILGSPKSPSIHACATLTVPSDKQIYNYVPLRWADKGDNERILVSEWEGDELSDAGFLKNDILVIEQLDKYKFCLDLIKETVGDVIDIYNLPLDEEGVYELFKNGYCSDVFQFGSKSLTNYLKELKPDNIDELIDATALYRPGPIRVNSHNEYILRKTGEKLITYAYGLKEVTKSTKGLLIYQEQIMEACKVLGNFTLVEADDIRKSIVKKNKEIIQSYKSKFIEGALLNKCPKDEAEEIWHELEVHGEYSFNLSHAAAYTLISYVGQWLKYHYPIQFWTTALQFSKDEEEISQYINEISKLESIEIIPPDINYSNIEFHTEYEKGKIYWSLSKIKFCGEVAVKAILDERNKNGVFYSFEEFLKRVNKSKVNKRIVINLILSGAFDGISDIKNVCDRIKLIKNYYKISLSKDIDKDEVINNTYNNREYYWILKQKELTGYGIINYRLLLKYSKEFISNNDIFVDIGDFFSEKNENKTILIAGLISKVIERSNKKGNYCQLELNCNDEVVNVIVWSDQYNDYKGKILDGEGEIVFIKGLCKFDTYRSKQAIYSDENFILEIIK